MTTAPTRPAASTGVNLTKRTDRSVQAKMGMARLSNGFLQDGAKIAALLRYTQLLFILGSIVLFAQLVIFTKVETRIFPTTVDGKLTTLPAPNRDIGSNTVLLWLMDALTQINTMGFHDYQMRLEEIRPYFTDRGWESFSRYLRGPQVNLPSIRSMLENDRLTLLPKFRRPPEIIRKGIVGGVFTYDVRARMLLLRDAVGAKADANLILDVNIERVPGEVNSSGIAIARWRVTNEK
jgi:hypothetical protein